MLSRTLFSIIASFAAQIAALSPQVSSVAAESLWHEALVTHLTSESVQLLEIQQPFVWAYSSQIKWFDDDTVLFGGISDEDLLRYKERRQSSQGRGGAQELLFALNGPGFRGNYVFSVKNNAYALVNRETAFCYDHESGRVLFGSPTHRIYASAKTVDQLLDPANYGNWSEHKASIDLSRHFWHQKNCSYLSLEKYGVKYGPEPVTETKIVLPRADGVFQYIGPLGQGAYLNHIPVLYDLEFRVVREFPLTQRVFSASTVSYAPWRGAYYQTDSRNVHGLRFYDEAQARYIPFRDHWRATNCLSLWWFDVKGRYETECVPYVPGGIHVYPLRHGRLVLSYDPNELDDVKASGLYWIPHGVDHAKLLLSALTVPEKWRGDISPNGCRAAVPAWRPGEERPSPTVMRLMIVQVC